MLDTSSSAAVLKLAGVAIAPQEAIQQAWQADRGRLQEALAEDQIDPQRMPTPKIPALPVLTDAQGNHYALHMGPLGPTVVPYEPGSPMELADGKAGQGGYLSVDQLEELRNSPGAADVLAAQGQLQAAAVRMFAQGNSGDGGGGQSNLLASAARSLAEGLAGRVLTELATGFGRTGTLRGAFDALANGAQLTPGLLRSLGAGVAGQLGSMAASMLLDSVWSVDDDSSTAEHAAHQAAQALASQLASELASTAVTGGSMFGNSAIAKIIKALTGGGAGVPALRVTDLDPAKASVLTGSANVFIEGPPAARESDKVAPPGCTVFNGAATVSINVLPAGRMTSVSCIGPFTKGATRTFIGGAGTGTMPVGLLGAAAGGSASAAAGGNGGNGTSGKPAAAAGADGNNASTEPSSSASTATTSPDNEYQLAPSLDFGETGPSSSLELPDTGTPMPANGNSLGPTGYRHQLSNPEEFAAAYNDPAQWTEVCPADAAGEPCLSFPPYPRTMAEQLYADYPNMRGHLDQVYNLGVHQYNCAGTTAEHIAQVLGASWQPQSSRGFDPVFGEHNGVIEQSVDWVLPQRNIDELFGNTFGGVKVPISQLDMNNPNNPQMAVVYTLGNYPTHVAYNTPQGTWVHQLGDHSTRLETPHYDDVETNFSHPAFAYLYPVTPSGQPIPGVSSK